MASDRPGSAARYMDVLSPSERAGSLRSTHNHKGSGCRDCGAIVYDKAAHDAFHDALEYAARAASRADGRTRRIT